MRRYRWCLGGRRRRIPLPMSEFVITEYQDSDRDACLDLLAATFPGGSNQATFSWRFDRHRELEPMLLCAKDENKIVSFTSWIPWKFTVGSTTFIGYQSGESATHPNYRRMGLWAQLLSRGYVIAEQRGVDFLFGYPSEMSYSTFIRAGYRPISVNFFRLRPIGLLKMKERRCYEYDIKYIQEHRLVENDKITPLFDNEYFRWRYIDAPKACDAVTYTEKNESALFLVRVEKWRGIRQAILMDCQVTTYDQRFVERAFDYLDRMYSRRAIWMRTFFSEESDRGRLLRRRFRIKVKSKYQVLCVKPVSGRILPSTLLEPNNWDIMPHTVDHL